LKEREGGRGGGHENLKTKKNAIVDYLDSQIPVIQLKGPKGDGDMQAAKRDCKAPPTRDRNIRLCGRQTDLSVMAVRVDVPNFFGSIDRY